MGRIENLEAPKGLSKIKAAIIASHTKCFIDQREVAAKIIVFDYGWKLPVCRKHLEEILALKEQNGS